MAPLLLCVRNVDLGTQVLLLRFLGVAIASLLIPFAFLIGLTTLQSDVLALGCAAIIAAMPEFAIDVARVGNECVAVALFTILTWLLARSVVTELTPSRSLAIGAVLGGGLLSKAYFLTAIPPVVLVLTMSAWRDRRRLRRLPLNALLVASSSFLIAGWWYLRNLSITGALSGIGEAATLPPGLNELTIVRKVTEIRWPVAANAILSSHLWFGGWSSLTVRSWMYHIFYAVVLVATVGLMGARRRLSALLPLIALYSAFWLGECYNALLLFVVKGMATSMGWYMYAVAASEVALCVAGLTTVLSPKHHAKIPVIGLVLFALLDIYTVHAVAIPYYTGLIEHRSNGTISSLHIPSAAQLGLMEIVDRLISYKRTVLSDSGFVILWSGYLVATGAIVVIAILLSLRYSGHDNRALSGTKVPEAMPGENLVQRKKSV